MDSCLLKSRNGTDGSSYEDYKNVTAGTGVVWWGIQPKMFLCWWVFVGCYPTYHSPIEAGEREESSSLIGQPTPEP